jgi:hypothetical protein
MLAVTRDLTACAGLILLGLKSNGAQL